ncbi:MAG TPA: DUF4124 domain-containing protein [Steroidobacteraceae bacterium]|nr:DUF4124 domain-containing protein [Steroidobacteraceae bacterium]
MSSRPLLRFVLPVLLAATALAVMSAQAAPRPSSSSSKKGGIAYKWVDEHGEVHYGDNVPPQYAQQDRTVLNQEGIAVAHVDAALTPEQAAAEAKKKAEAIKQRQHDSFLVSTYTSVADIEALRDVRLDQLHGQRAAADAYVESLRSRLGGLQARAMSFLPYTANARRMPDDVAENLVRTVNEMRQQAAALAAKAEEEKTLRSQFDADIARYQELHTIHSQ